MPPVPLYEGTRPYQTLPFQWSLHTVAADGALTHAAFLARRHGRPAACVRRDADRCPSTGSGLPVLVYSAYEQTRLAGACPADA